MNHRSASKIQQVGTCLAASGGLLSSGMTVAFPSVAVLNISDQVSWVASASHLGMIVGSLAIGPILDNSGRKFGLVLALLLSVIGWSVLGGGIWVVGGRILTGFSAGMSSAPVSVLIAEISTIKLRAALTTFKHTAFSLGLFIMYCLGLVVKDDWKTAGLVSAGVCCFCLLTVLLCVPETGTGGGRSRPTYLSFFRALSRADVREPFVLMAGLSALKQLAGTTVVLSYATELLRQGGLEQASLGAVGMGGIRLVASLSAAPLAAWFGRRALASYGGYFASLALLVFAWDPSAAPLPALVTFVFSSALASSAIQAFVGEVFLPDFRAVSTGLTTTTTYACAWAALHSYPWLISKLGLKKLLSVYASISVLATIITLCFLKENTVILEREEDRQLEGNIEAAVPLQDPTEKELESNTCKNA